MQHIYSYRGRVFLPRSIKKNAYAMHIFPSSQTITWISSPSSIIAYGFLFLVAGLGYAVLPDFARSIALNCSFKQITGVHMPLRHINKYFYSFEDGSNTWDSTKYSVGDVVCVKK